MYLQVIFIGIKKVLDEVEFDATKAADLIEFFASRDVFCGS